MALTERQELDLIFLIQLETELGKSEERVILLDIIRRLTDAAQEVLYDELVEKRITSREVRETEVTDEAKTDLDNWIGKRRV